MDNRTIQTTCIMFVCSNHLRVSAATYRSAFVCDVPVPRTLIGGWVFQVDSSQSRYRDEVNVCTGEKYMYVYNHYMYKLPISMCITKNVPNVHIYMYLECVSL